MELERDVWKGLSDPETQSTYGENDESSNTRHTFNSTKI